jgi:hypothetical protein
MATFAIGRRGRGDKWLTKRLTKKPSKSLSQARSKMSTQNESQRPEFPPERATKISNYTDGCSSTTSLILLNCTLTKGGVLRYRERTKKLIHVSRRFGADAIEDRDERQETKQMDRVKVFG